MRPLEAQTSSPVFLGFFIGFGLWVALYIFLPRPARSYVLAHEMTHAVWATWFGARVVGMKVGREEGHVLLTNTNFLITLAPYFFPFYTFITLLVYGVVSLGWNQDAFSPFWYGLIGLTLAYHLTFTFSALHAGQDDLREHGFVFSLPVIYIGNLLVLSAGILLIARPGWEPITQQITSDQAWIWAYALEIVDLITEKLPIS